MEIKKRLTPHPPKLFSSQNGWELKRLYDFLE